MATSIVSDAGTVTITIDHNAESKEYPTTNPSIYETQHRGFVDEGQPTTSEGWVERARKVAEILAVDAAARDIENKSPRAEISLLKSSGLLKLLGPKDFGGGAQTWEVGYKVIREVAKGDGSIGMLLGYHLLWSTTANTVGDNEQKARFQKLIIENNYYVGGPYMTDFRPQWCFC